MSELGYIIGVLLGDGWISKSHNHGNYEVGLEVYNEEFANKFDKALEKTTSIKPSIYKRKRFITCFKTPNNPNGYTVFCESIHVRISSKEWYHKFLKIRNNWFDLPKEEMKSIIEGFFDSEGCLSKYKLKKYYYVKFSNKNYILLKKIKNILNDFGINISGIYSNRNNYKKVPFHDLIIYNQQEVKKFCKLFDSFKIPKNFGVFR